MQTNILDWLEATATRTPERIAVGDAQQDYTWAQLAENARRAGSFLAGHTVLSGKIRAGFCRNARHCLCGLLLFRA